MSWSVSVIGKPDAIKTYLDAESARLTDKSKEEFDVALPALKTLLDLQVENGLIQLTANGHSYESAGKKYSTCNVDMRQLGYQFVQ